MVLLNNDETTLVLTITNKVEVTGNEAILRVAALITKMATSLQTPAAAPIEVQMAEANDLLDEDDEEVDTVVMSIADTKRAIDQ